MKIEQSPLFGFYEGNKKLGEIVARVGNFLYICVVESNHLKMEELYPFYIESEPKTEKRVSYDWVVKNDKDPEFRESYIDPGKAYKRARYLKTGI